MRKPAIRAPIPTSRGSWGAYFAAQPAGWETWFAQRDAGQLGAAEADAAHKAAVHANTPATVHLDALARPFLTIGRNRYVRDGVTIDEVMAARVEWDIEDNQRSVEDARQRVVVRYDYDMLGRKIHEASMDAGERWFLNDVAGSPVRRWDSRGFMRRMTFDALRRPTGTFVTENGIERLDHRTVYGEGQGSAANLRTRVFQTFDGAGIATNVAYDFKGNLTESRRDLLPGYDQEVDLGAEPTGERRQLSPTRASYDALDRAVTTTTPDGSVLAPCLQRGGPARWRRRHAAGGGGGDHRASPTSITTPGANARGSRTATA